MFSTLQARATGRLIVIVSVAAAGCSVIKVEHVADTGNSRPVTTAPVAAPGAGPPTGSAPSDWRAAEAGVLENHVQLTFADRFYRAGEAYFSPDDSRVIFQAVETPAPGVEPAEFYGMYLGDVVRSSSGAITGLENVRELSPKGSANTCGWFDPHDPNIVYFGSTITPPQATDSPGFNRKSGRYKWMFPVEMSVYRCDLRKPAGAPESLEHLAGSGKAYCAEDGLSPDGRHMVYCSLDSGEGDLYIMNLETGRSVPVVTQPGYDGGPFFSPDGRRICYRSDRRKNHYLQIFVADLAFDTSGSVVGIEREYQLTDNGHVNWAPFWHPDGRHLVYATSEIGHRNYEIFALDADSGRLAASGPSIKYGTRGRRITNADRADVLPTFNRDGTLMLWTSQRGASGRSQLWVANFVLDLDAYDTQ